MVNKLSPTFFKRHCVTDDVTGCWIWQKRPQSSGYGQFKHGGGQISLAHRASYHVHVGPIPVGLHVLHKCDNRLCCNPAHLFLGTQQDNMRDAAEKGRLRVARSPHTRVRKLTDEQVREIRTSKLSALELAAKFGVKRPCIYQIRNGNRKALVSG